jgi:peptidyl-prolyl cis-trans isomerase D
VGDEQYSRFVRDTYRMQVPSYESFLKNNELRFFKYQNLLFSSAYISEEEITQDFLEKNKKIQMEMLILNTYDVASEISLDKDDELEKFYNENKSLFKTGPQRRLQYVSFAINDYLDQVTFTDEDLLAEYNDKIERYRQPEQVTASHILIKTEKRTEEEALAEITKIAKELEEGLDFAEAAKKYSDDTSASRGGDLGPFPRGREAPQFEATAFAMKVGDVSAPVKTQLGYHIIKKTGAQEEKVRSFEDVKAGLTNNVKRARASTFARGLADTFLETINEGVSFADAAKQYSYEIKVSDAFDDDNLSDLGEGLGKNFQLRRAAFALQEINDVTPTIDAGANMVVAQWVEEVEPRDLDYATEKNRIRNQAKKSAGKLFIEKTLEEIRQAALAAPDKSFMDLKGDREFLKENHFKTTDFVNNVPSEISSDDLTFEDLYALEPGTFLEKTETRLDTRYVLARLVAKQEPDIGKLDEERKQIVQRLRSQRGGEIFGNLIFERQKQLDPDGSKQGRLLQFFVRK